LTIKMILPGVYEFDPSTPGGDDLMKHEKLKEFSNIPPEYRKNGRFSTFEIVEGRQEGFDAACSFVRGEIVPPLLMLYGEPGRSKTHLATAIGNTYIAQLVSVLFYHSGDLLDDLRHGMRIEMSMSPVDAVRSTITSSSIIQRCKLVGLLILDDLGLGDETEWAWGKLDTIVNYRYDYHLPTVITANTLEVSDRIRDRCREGLVVRLEGESYREILAKRKKEK
jgi:DNA replication protein DnaC